MAILCSPKTLAFQHACLKMYLWLVFKVLWKGDYVNFFTLFSTKPAYRGKSDRLLSMFLINYLNPSHPI